MTNTDILPLLSTLHTPWPEPMTCAAHAYAISVHEPFLGLPDPGSDAITSSKTLTAQTFTNELLLS